MRRFIITGTKSGCGKTTVTCGVLAALKKRGLDAAAFKCGPDYIDSMFHRKAIGVSSCNLDSFFCERDMLLYLLDRYGGGHDVSVIEGVMGFYDGSSGSAWSVSEMTETPAVIVIDCRGMSDSIGAIMSGFLRYRKNRIAGFIFSRLPEKLIPLAERLCEKLGTEYLGSMPKTDITFESRHLGLVTADEIGDIQEKTERLGELAEKYIRIDRLLALCDEPLPEFAPPVIPHYDEGPVIAVARDSAFCFLYEESIGLLEAMGCRVKYFAPLDDGRVPEADGLILCGGYPELYAERLAENISMKYNIKRLINGGMPTIAECGGFMYLHDSLTDKDGRKYPMAGVISGEVYPAGRLTRFGYISMTARKDGLLCGCGDMMRAHEFHYWDSTSCGDGFSAEKADGRKWECCHVSDTLYAGFPHIYLYSDIGAAERFVRKCIEYGEKNG